MYETSLNSQQKLFSRVTLEHILIVNAPSLSQATYTIQD